MWASLLLLLTLAEQEPELVVRPLVTSRHAMVASLSPLASTAGMRILLRGGNAFDAAVATAVAVAVVDPKNSTIGGQGFATIYVAKTKEVRALNFFGPAPGKATVEALTGKDYLRGYLATPVPSNLKGYQALLEAHGTMSWAEVLEPAIELAEEGFVLPEEDGPILERNRELFEKYPSSAPVFLPGGVPPQSGDVFVQKDLARTLRAIADEGPDVFYRGEIARKIASFYRENGGILDYDDLAGYQARWVTPIVTEYRGLRFYSQPPNSSAAALLLQLNLLEPYDLKALGHNSADYLHRVGEVMRIAISDRNRYIADPDFAEVPVERILSKDYARERGRAIRIDETMPAVPAPTSSEKPEPENTTHLSVVDEEGNMVALTQTLGAWFGSGVVAADTGVLFSNQMRHLHLEPGSPSRVGPGRRPRSNQSPTIVLRDGEPFMALGTPGNDAIWQRLTQVILNVVDHGMDIQSAISAPRMIYGAFQEHGTEIPPEFEVESRIAPEVVEALRARGYRIEIVPQDGGRVNGIVRDPRTGFLYGGADPRGSVYVVGW